MSDGMSSDDEGDDGNTGDSTEQCNETEEQEDIVDEELQERPEDFSIDVEPIEIGSETEEHSHEEPVVWSDFKIVGDNIDKNIRPSFQRVNHQTVSLHYFHSCAVSDRVDFSSLSDISPSCVSLSPASLLPSTTDLDAIKEELKCLLAGMHYCIMHNFMESLLRIQDFGSAFQKLKLSQEVYRVAYSKSAFQ